MVGFHFWNGRERQLVSPFEADSSLSRPQAPIIVGTKSFTFILDCFLKYKLYMINRIPIGKCERPAQEGTHLFLSHAIEGLSR